MPNYRRYHVPGGTYFFTLVTFNRAPILCSDIARPMLRNAMERVREKWPFQSFAMVLLPDHLHAVWTLPQGDSDYPMRWAKIKEHFTRDYCKARATPPPNRSRQRRRERSVWQRRFWEHTCESDDDLKRFIDYVHWNPVKHGLVKSVVDYPWSTFQKFVAMGEYAPNWGSVDPCPDWHDPEWE